MPDDELDDHAVDVACACAAYLANVLPEILPLAASVRYARFQQIFETAILADRKGRQAFSLPPEPSPN